MKYRLEELVDLQIGRTPPRKEFEWFNTNGDGYKWVSIKDMGNSGRFISDTSEYLTEAAQKRFGIPIVDKGTLLLSFKLTVGRLCITTDKMLTNEAIAQLPIKDTNIVDRDFLYYYLKNYNFHQLGSTSSIATAINSTYLKKMEIDLPPIDQQRAIAAVLSSIDDKIESNNAINNNLMQQIQSLFSDWFVTFTPFGGNKPSSWNKTDIYAISKVIYGAPFASKAFNTERNGVPIIRIRDLKEQQFVTYTTETHPKGYLLKPGDVVVGMDGEFRPYIWGNDKAWLNQRVCVFENKRPNGKAFLYCVIKPLLYAIEQTQVGTTVIHIGKKDFDSFEFWLPEDCVLDKFDSLTNPMYQQIVFSLLENKKLVVLRDTLLPKLLSGEINVSDIDL